MSQQAAHEAGWASMAPTSPHQGCPISWPYHGLSLRPSLSNRRPPQEVLWVGKDPSASYPLGPLNGTYLETGPLQRESRIEMTSYWVRVVLTDNEGILIMDRKGHRDRDVK